MKTTYKKTVSIAALDEYAKKLSKKQVDRLYEAKNHKKYKKQLYENYDDTTFNMYLDEYTLANNNISMKDIEMNIIKPLKLNENKIEGGINLSTKNEEKYLKIVKTLQKMGLDKEIIKNGIDAKFEI